MFRQLRSSLIVGAVAASLALAGCGSDSDSGSADVLDKITVTDNGKKAPGVKVASPLAIGTTVSKVTKQGDGATVGKGDLVTVEAIIVNANSGDEAFSSWDINAIPLDLSAPGVYKAFTDSLPGKKVGDRVVIAATPTDAFGGQGSQNLEIAASDPVVFVMDIEGTTPVLPEATGKAVAPKKGLPTVKMTEGKPATITIPKSKPPTKLVSQDLIVGKGAKTKDGDTIRVAYTGVVWSTGEVFDSTASRPEQPYFSFILGQKAVISGWDKGLVGKTVGSRVLLVIPPNDGYGAAGKAPTIKGTDTLVFVVDILAAS